MESEIFNFLIDQLTQEVSLEIHRSLKLSKSNCNQCGTKCRTFISRVGVDVHGLNPIENVNDKHLCPSCNISFPSSRFAPHLEKCLGLGRRSKIRGTQSSPPVNSDDEPDNKKRKISPTNNRK